MQSDEVYSATTGTRGQKVRYPSFPRRGAGWCGGAQTKTLGLEWFHIGLPQGSALFGGQVGLSNLLGSEIQSGVRQFVVEVITH